MIAKVENVVRFIIGVIERTIAGAMVKVITEVIIGAVVGAISNLIVGNRAGSIMRVTAEAILGSEITLWRRSTGIHCEWRNGVPEI